MADENKVLDLDALFGQARAVKVKWQGKEYELLRLEAIGPRQAVKFQKLQLRAAKLQNVDEEMSDEQAAELEAVFNDILKLLCEELPLETMTVLHKMNILAFYTEQTQGKKVMELALKKIQTGARRSRK